MIMLDGIQLYTLDESAALLGKGVRTIYNKVKAGTIKTVVVSGVKHISGDELKAEAERQKEGGRKRGTETGL